MEEQEQTSLVTNAEADTGETVTNEAQDTGEATEITAATTEAADDETTESSSETTDGDADEAAIGAPVDYSDFTMPDGMEIDKAAMEKFSPLAKELNLTQEQAQKLVDLQSSTIQEAATAQVKTWEDTRSGWQKEAKDDKDVGGDKLNENLALGKKAVDAFGSPELNALLNEGHGDRLPLIKMLANIGRAMGDDTIDTGRSPGAEEIPMAQRLYSNSNMNP